MQGALEYAVIAAAAAIWIFGSVTATREIIIRTSRTPDQWARTTPTRQRGRMGLAMTAGRFMVRLHQ